MRVLIYKRTHIGDPDETGIFGIEDCMGKIRNWKFDAVIGIGGKTPWKGHEGIKYKINWIGVDPKKVGETPRGKVFAFKNFELYEANGKSIENNFPNLFKHMYKSRKRFDMSVKLPKPVDDEVIIILNLVQNSAQSKLYDSKNLTISTLKSLRRNCGCSNKSVCLPC